MIRVRDTQVKPISVDLLLDQRLALGLRQVERLKGVRRKIWGINDHVNLGWEDLKGRFRRVQNIEYLKEHSRRTIKLTVICENLEREAELE
ncbi:hypothetical protein TNCV_1728931 [Trichonephila clavipes]|nr:hypothetical protein TNCV_1728931 [Trichonephila clavipes]